MVFVVRFFGRLVVAVAIVAIVLFVGVARGKYLHVGGDPAPAWPPAEPVTVAVVWPESDAVTFTHGAKLALEELDAAGGPLAGKIRLEIIEEERDEDAVDVARRVVAHDGVVAALGHEFSGSAVAASLVYEQHGVIFMAPTATAPRLTSHSFSHVFRLTPDDRTIAAAHAQFARSRGWSTAAVFYARTEGGEAASAHFVSHMREAGIRVPFTRSYLPRSSNHHIDFRPLIAGMEQSAPDVVMIADQLPRAADLIADLRAMGYKGPILGSDKLDSERVWSLSRGTAQDLYVATPVDTAAVTPAYVAFSERFTRRWQESPSYLASQGYEAMRLLGEAMTASQAVDPITVSTTLRTRKWAGLFGDYSFSWNGDIHGRGIYIKHMNGGTFTTVHKWKEQAQ